MNSTEQPTITLTMEQAQSVFNALDIGLGAATQEAAEYHEKMKGYREHAHKRLDDDVATVNAALTLMGQLMESASINSVVCEAGEEPSGETMAQREEVCAAWADLPAALTAHPAMKRLYRALGGILHRDSPPPPGSARDSADLPVKWKDSEGATHEISLDYAAQIAQWMFDKYGDVPQVDAVLNGESRTEPEGADLLDGGRP